MLDAILVLQPEVIVGNFKRWFQPSGWHQRLKFPTNHYAGPFSGLRVGKLQFVCWLSDAIMQNC